MLTVRSLVGRERSRGQTLTVFAIFLVVLLGATALAVDYGSWLKARRDYQNVVDAAALQGSVLLERPVTVAKQINARRATWQSLNDQLGLGLSNATLDGFAASNTAVGTPESAGGYQLWVSTPPLGGPGSYGGNYAGSNRVVFAWVDRENSAFFSRILGIGDQRISAWATSGSFPNRFAVITLRKNGQPTNGNPTDLDVNGGTVLNVFDGDVGGNWGLSVNGVGSAIVMHSSTGDSYGVYMTENVPTGGNGWTPTQVRTPGGTPIPVQYHAEVADPQYPAPCLTYAVAPTASCLEDRTATWGSAHSATTNRVGETCPATGLDVLPAGRYHDIRVPNGKCLVLDPSLSPVAGKQNGIYYFTGNVDLNNSALVIGDGVTLIFQWSSSINKFNMNAGASISLNSGNATNNPLAANCNPDCKFGGWAVKAGGGGTLTWTTGLAPTHSAPSDPFERGMAVYVCRSSASCGTGGGPSTDILQMNAGSGIDYRGLIYAPFDNVKLAGQLAHDDIGQLVAWTAMFTGGTAINQTFDGPDSITPVLLEPRLGQ
jgi:hypothetical protein